MGKEAVFSSMEVLLACAPFILYPNLGLRLPNIHNMLLELAAQRANKLSDAARHDSDVELGSISHKNESASSRSDEVG